MEKEDQKNRERYVYKQTGRVEAEKEKTRLLLVIGQIYYQR